MIFSPRKECPKPRFQTGGKEKMDFTQLGSQEEDYLERPLTLLILLKMLLINRGRAATRNAEIHGIPILSFSSNHKPNNFVENYKKKEKTF